MAVKTPKRYQEKAIEKLIQKSEWLFEDKDLHKRTIVLQSPTGSGKTFMMSLFIQELIEKFDKKGFELIKTVVRKPNKRELWIVKRRQ